MSALADMLIRREGTGPRLPNGHHGIYRDNSAEFGFEGKPGKVTGGWGHNFDDGGLSDTAAAFILDEDIAEAQADLRRHCPWFSSLDSVRQDAVTAMVFNMGIDKFLGFHRMIAALQIQDWVTAKREGFNSDWAREVGDQPGQRAYEVMAMIVTGQYQV